MPGNRTGQRDKRDTDRREDMLLVDNYEREDLKQPEIRDKK